MKTEIFKHYLIRYNVKNNPINNIKFHENKQCSLIEYISINGKYIIKNTGIDLHRFLRNKVNIISPYISPYKETYKT
jgi:hypothetical protein